MKLEFDRYTIHPRVPFTIARGSTSAYERVRVRLRGSGAHEGWGEAAPNAFYRESADTVVAALARLAAVLERHAGFDDLDAIARLERELRAAVPGDASARAAVSAAAHDLLGKCRGQPLWRLFGLDPAHAPPSSFTIVIPADEGALAQRIAEAQRYPILKLKLGSDRDEWIVRAVRRAAPTKVLRADANAAWTAEHAVTMAGFLADHGFELLEQPVAREDLDGLRTVMRASPIPIVADESCHTTDDVERLTGHVHGINIKLSKCGGIAEARAMALLARERGMLVMLGCMVESTLGIAAAAHLAPLADYADLDGAALLRDDPFTGVSIEDGLIRLPAEPGLGVKPSR